MTTSVRSTRSSPASSSSTSQWTGMAAEPGLAINKGKTSSRGRGGRRGRGKGSTQTGSPPSHKSGSSATSSTASTAPLARGEAGGSQLSPPIPASCALQQSINSMKSHSRRRRVDASKGFASQASEHNSETTYCTNTSRSQKPSRPSKTPVHPVHSKMLGSPNSPNSTSDIKSNIDALVERVRASAMANNRPYSPGGHIDWAVDDDNSLPDLDDWGIQSPTRHVMISPIIVDGLTPLPEFPVDLSLTESHKQPLVKESTRASDHLVQPSEDQIQSIAEDVGKPLKLDEPVEPSTFGGPEGATAMQSDGNLESAAPGSSVHSPLRAPLPPQPARLIQQGENFTSDSPRTDSRERHLRTCNRGAKAMDHKTISSNVQSTFQFTGSDSKKNEKGLAASIHAPEELVAREIAAPVYSCATPEHDPLPETIGITHPAQGTGHLPSRPRPAGRFLPSGGTTPQPRTSVGNNPHLQTSRVARNPIRSSQNRPVLTGDALSKLAKTIGNTTARVQDPSNLHDRRNN